DDLADRRPRGRAAFGGAPRAIVHPAFAAVSWADRGPVRARSGRRRKFLRPPGEFGKNGLGRGAGFGRKREILPRYLAGSQPDETALRAERVARRGRFQLRRSGQRANGDGGHMDPGGKAGDGVFSLRVGYDGSSVFEVDLDARHAGLHPLGTSGIAVTVLDAVAVEVHIDLAEDDALVAENTSAAPHLHHGAGFGGTHRSVAVA